MHPNQRTGPVVSSPVATKVLNNSDLGPVLLQNIEMPRGARAARVMDVAMVSQAPAESLLAA